MNIMVPLANLNQLDEFCEAGADEFYFGFHDDAWTFSFGPFEELNRMSSFGTCANFSWNRIKTVIAQIHKRNKKAYAAINSAAYSFQQLSFLDAYIEQLQAFHVDGLILGSAALIYRLRRCDVPLVVSTMSGAYNSDIIRFYCDMGVSRIVLPRDMTLNDIEKVISRFPQIEFEVFIMRNGCKYSDSNCMSYHARKYGSMCAALDIGPYAIETDYGLTAQEFREIHTNHTLFVGAFHKKACGLCAVDRLKQIGIHSVKIVGRADDLGSVCDDIRKVRMLIDNPGYSEEYFGENCLYQLNCYYMV